MRTIEEVERENALLRGALTAAHKTIEGLLALLPKPGPVHVGAAVPFNPGAPFAPLPVWPPFNPGAPFAPLPVWPADPLPFGGPWGPIGPVIDQTFSFDARATCCAAGIPQGYGYFPPVNAGGYIPPTVFELVIGGPQRPPSGLVFGGGS